MSAHRVFSSFIFSRWGGDLQQEGLAMKEFRIHIDSFQQVQEFVSLATVQPFRVLAISGDYLVNAKSFIGMVSLDYSQPVRVRCDCGEEAFSSFRQQAQRFLAT